MNIANTIKRAAAAVKRGVAAMMYDAAEISPDRNARAFFDRRTNAAEDTAVSTYERDILIAQTRDMVRNNTVVSGLLERIADMTIGQGIEPHPTTTDPAWNEAAQRLWRAWARDPEGRGRRTSLNDLLKLCVTGVPVEGGAAVLKYRDGTIELVELVRFRPHPDDAIAGGRPYRMDNYGRITHWCIWDREPDGTFSNDRRRARWVAAGNVLTMFHRTRPDQVMPTPTLASAVPTLRDMKELNDYTLRQAKVQSTPAIVHMQADENDQLPVRSRRSIAAQEDPLAKLADVSKMPVISTRGDLKTLAPATPCSTYESFQRYNLQLVAMSQSIPLDVLMLFFSDGTFASSKATLTQAHEAILQRQHQVIESLLRPLWVWKMANAVARGELPAPPPDSTGLFPSYDAVAFRLPSYEWMDAADATQTEAQEVLMGVRTLGEMARKRGHDLRDLLEERAREMELVAKIAEEHNVDATQLSQIVLNGGGAPQRPTNTNNGETK